MLKTSFIEINKNSDFPLQNLPYGAFLAEGGETHLCTAIGDLVVDLFVQGVDVSQVNPDTFGFIFVGDNSEIMGTESETLQFSIKANWFRVKAAEIIAPTDQTPPGARYAFIR